MNNMLEHLASDTRQRNWPIVLILVSDLEPFLKMAVTSAFFHFFGTTPLSVYRLLGPVV